MSRAIWDPLLPKCVKLVRDFPTNIKEKPAKTILATLAFLPISIPTFITLPFLFFGDTILQKLHKHYGAPIDVLYEDGAEMMRIAFRSAALSSKETFRLIRQFGRKIKEHPVTAMVDVIQGFYYVIFHPVEVATMAYRLLEPATKAFFGSFYAAWWLKDPARGRQPPRESAQ